MREDATVRLIYAILYSKDSYLSRAKIVEEMNIWREGQGIKPLGKRPPHIRALIQLMAKEGYLYEQSVPYRQTEMKLYAVSYENMSDEMKRTAEFTSELARFIYIEQFLSGE